jgi:hypothetical protein
MEFKKYKMAMRNRISPKNRDFVIDRERAPFDDNVKTGEGMYDAGGFMTYTTNRSERVSCKKRIYAVLRNRR